MGLRPQEIAQQRLGPVGSHTSFYDENLSVILWRHMEIEHGLRPIFHLGARHVTASRPSMRFTLNDNLGVIGSQIEGMVLSDGVQTARNIVA